jgi:hypothetical protein
VLKLILVGLWVCGVTLGSSYAATLWKASHGPKATAQEESSGGTEYKKTKMVNVPMLADGAVQGYVMAQFVFTVDAGLLKNVTVQPEVFLQDEAFRALYSDENLDFRHLERYDMNKLTKSLAQKVNERLEAKLIKDVLIQEFNYVSRDDMKK